MTEVAVNHTERLQTVHSVLKCRTDAESSRKELATDLSEALVAANIPVEKLDHPAIRRFLEKRVPGAGAIPTANRIRQWYLPTLQKAHDAELYKILSQADGIILTVDESSDNVTERSVLNLVMTPIVADKASTKVVSYLGDQIYLDKIDHKVVAAEVMRVINKFDVKHSRVLAYITDNVAYMTKSFTLFSAFFENCVLVTCTAHLFHLLIDRVPMYATEVHKFITKWQAYFKNSVPRRKRFADFIAGKGLSTAKCPKPCTTRWTPWLRAVLWHEERNRFVSEFLDSEHDQSGKRTK